MGMRIFCLSFLILCWSGCTPTEQALSERPPHRFSLSPQATAYKRNLEENKKAPTNDDRETDTLVQRRTSTDEQTVTPSRRTVARSATQTTEDSDEVRLAQLWEKRMQDTDPTDYPIGPGDVLKISAPDVENLKDRTVRVSGQGMITLPLVGTLQAHGLTEDELRAEIVRRLQADYVYDPQVDIFVKEYRSRQVAVIGAVQKPGLYNLASGADTILDMIAQAGGMTKEAASRISFIPAEPVSRPEATQLASVLPVQIASKNPVLLKRTDPIMLDLQLLAQGGSQHYLTLPARPGDVIMVPGGGDVLVQGWVGKPGSYKITPGLTILGAVAAAGGPLYPADTSAVRIIRTGKKGEKIFLETDLEKIKHGEQPDISLQEGDVVDVSPSNAKLVPYGFYRFFTTIFNIGASAPLYYSKFQMTASKKYAKLKA